MGAVCLRAGGPGGPGSLRAEGLCGGLWGCSLEPGNRLQQTPRHSHSEALPTSGLGRSLSRTDLCCSRRLGCPRPVPQLPAAPSSQLAPSNGRVQVPASLGPLCLALDPIKSAEKSRSDSRWDPVLAKLLEELRAFICLQCPLRVNSFSSCYKTSSKSKRL